MSRALWSRPGAVLHRHSVHGPAPLPGALCRSSPPAASLPGGKLPSAWGCKVVGSSQECSSGVRAAESKQGPFLCWNSQDAVTDAPMGRDGLSRKTSSLRLGVPHPVASVYLFPSQGICFIRTSRPENAIIYNNNEDFQVGQAKVSASHAPGAHRAAWTLPAVTPSSQGPPCPEALSLTCPLCHPQVVLKSKDDQVTVIGAGVTLHEALAAAELLKKGEKGPPKSSTEWPLHARSWGSFFLEELTAKEKEFHLIK